jgi:BASS family bile acid:Na+ symporter
MNLSIVFICAFILGLVFPQYSPIFEDYFFLMLGTIMFLSLLDLEFTRKIGSKRDILLVLFFNYGVLGGFLIGVGSFFDLSFFQGFVIMAVAPPAVAVVPFTYILHGDLKLSLMGEAFAYLSSVFIAPITVFLIFGKTVDYVELLKILVEFIILPMFLAFIVSRMPFYRKIKDKRDYLVNILMFLLIYTIIGLNSEDFFRVEVLDLFIVGFFKAFGLGFSVFYLLKRMNRKKRISYTLFSSYKNCGISAAVALDIFGKQASLSSIMVIPFELLFFIVLNFWMGKKIK